MSMIIDLISLFCPDIVKTIIAQRASDSMFDIYGLREWKRIIFSIVSSGIKIEGFAEKLANSRALTRAYYSIFTYSRPLCLKKIVLAVAIEVLDNGFQLDDNRIIQLATEIHDRWLQELKDNSIFRDRYEKKTGYTLSDSNNSLLDEEQYLDLIRDKTRLRKEFFRSYSTDRVTDHQIRVFLPNKRGYVDWANTDKIVDISVNQFKQFELGFFRIGYDYKWLDVDESAWIATISKDEKKEVVRFVNENIGEITKKVLWLR